MPSSTTVHRAAAASVGLVALLAGCDQHRRPTASGPPGTATVMHDIDGDTIDVRLGGRTERVRLLGIDTPETKDPRRPVQCFGKEASDHTAELLPKGTVVRLERDVEARDRYGRLLAYVFRAGDGLFVNLDLVSGGFASVYTFPPNVAHADELRAAAARARTAGAGLWGRCGGPGKPAR